VIQIPNELLNFIITSSLYAEYTIENNPELEQLVQIFNKQDRFEMFCPECGDKKVFMYDGGFSDVTVKNICNGLHTLKYSIMKQGSITAPLLHCLLFCCHQNPGSSTIGLIVIGDFTLVNIPGSSTANTATVVEMVSVNASNKHTRAFFI